MAKSFQGRLIIIVDFDYCGTEKRWLEMLNQLSQLEPRDSFCIQVRIKGQNKPDYISLATKAREIVDSEVTTILNGDPQIASDLGYDGVHLPKNHWRRLTELNETNLLVSAAAHSTDALRFLNGFRVSMVLYSPIFAPTWKSRFGEPKGLEGLRKGVQDSAHPIYALGGIGEKETRRCLDAGAKGVAVLSGIVGTEDACKSAQSYLRYLYKHS
ncbi:MAG: thiamine phosphate synthase [Gammaproteobacteria bacterium]|nr:thiamine phosphate synthase [Gammaproteobacteria bacterium]